MKLNLSLVVFALIAVTIFSSAAKAQKIDGKVLDFFAGNKITGEWRINYAESDNPISKMQTLLQNKIALSADEKNIGSKNDALPTMSVSLVPPESLTLAGDDEKSITINEAFSTIVFTRTFATDGKQRIGELQGGANFLIAATQNDKYLKVEVVSPRGNKMTESYVLDGDGKKLIVTVRFEDARAKEILTLRRVYDRAIADVISDGLERIQ